MDEAAAIREGVDDVLSDVDPDGLREMAIQAVEDAWNAPGVVTLVAARKSGVEDGGADLRRRAVGVQLIYTGLALSRRLIEGEPWAQGDTDTGNMDVIVADVLVARGGHLLAYTDAVDRGVQVVRRFGRRETGDGTGGTRELEADILELAGHAGSTVAGTPPSPAVMEWAEGLGESVGSGELPEVASLLPAVESGTGGSVALAGERRQSSDP